MASTETDAGINHVVIHAALSEEAPSNTLTDTPLQTGDATTDPSVQTGDATTDTPPQTGVTTASWGPPPDTRISEVKSNSRGIPAATFFEDVSETCTKNAGGPEAVLKELHHLYGKYKFMESSLVTQKSNLVTKIPEIKNALAAVNFLVKKQENNESVETQFEVADAIYAKATIKPENRVLLWLGANVMLEYGYVEARELLTKNLANAQVNLTTLDNDLAFLKDQITISEVNIARVHNHKVQLKQDAARALGPKAIKA
jgi:prefoldin subunit 5